MPFLSKVTGVPMVELAVRIALGRDARRSSAGTAGCSPPPPFVAVKAPAFSTAKLRGVDPSVGPGHAVDRRGHRDPRRTRGSRWPRRCSARRSSRRGRATSGALALLSIADRDKGRCRGWPRRSPAAGYRLAATPGTRAALAAAGYDVAAGREARRGRRRGRSARSPILDLIASGEVRLVVNTPTPRSGAVRDAAEIRLAAIAEGILCLTAIETAVAAAEALDPAIAERAVRRPLARRVGAAGPRSPPRLVATGLTRPATEASRGVGTGRRDERLTRATRGSASSAPTMTTRRAGQSRG